MKMPQNGCVAFNLPDSHLGERSKRPRKKSNLDAHYYESVAQYKQAAAQYNPSVNL